MIYYVVVWGTSNQILNEPVISTIVLSATSCSNFARGQVDFQNCHDLTASFNQFETSAKVSHRSVDSFWKKMEKMTTKTCVSPFLIAVQRPTTFSNFAPKRTNQLSLNFGRYFHSIERQFINSLRFQKWASFREQFEKLVSDNTDIIVDISGPLKHY